MIMANTKLMCNISTLTWHYTDKTGKESIHEHATSLKAASISARDPSDLTSYINSPEKRGYSYKTTTRRKQVEDYIASYIASIYNNHENNIA